MSTIPDTTVQLKDGSTITIRTARPEDARAVLEHARPIFAEEEFLLTTPDDFHMTEEQGNLQVHQLCALLPQLSLERLIIGDCS
jgi:hypothetical protein